MEARGGEAAIRRHRHVTWKGKFEMVGMGITGTVLLHASAPNLFHIAIDASGVGLITQGFDGTVGWGDNPMTGPTVNAGKELEMTRIQSDFYADLNTAEYFSKVETVGRETYAGEPSYKVAFTTKGGIELFTYYSVATGLMVGTNGNFPTAMGDVFVETETGEFKEFDGVLYPTRSVQKVMGAEQVLRSASRISARSIPPSTRCRKRSRRWSPDSRRSDLGQQPLGHSSSISGVAGASIDAAAALAAMASSGAATSARRGGSPSTPRPRADRTGSPSRSPRQRARQAATGP